jgi:hypothetical protein
MTGQSGRRNVPRSRLKEVIEMALLVGNADQAFDSEPKIGTKTKFIVRLIDMRIPNFWEKPASYVANRLEKEKFKHIRTILHTSPLELGLAISDLQNTKSLDPQNTSEPEIGSSRAMGEVEVPGMEPGAWGNFLQDEQLSHPKYAPYKRSSLLRALIAEHLPAALFDRWDKLATFEDIVWAQHTAVLEYQRLARPKPGSTLSKFVETKLGLYASYNDIAFFLAVHGIDEEAYCAQKPGIPNKVFQRLSQGKLTLGTIYTRHPAFILRPLIPSQPAKKTAWN